MIEHAKGCKRRRPPLLRTSWDGQPQLWCADCGRTCPAPDTRTNQTGTANG